MSLQLSPCPPVSSQAEHLVFSKTHSCSQCCPPELSDSMCETCTCPSTWAEAGGASQRQRQKVQRSLPSCLSRPRDKTPTAKRKQNPGTCTVLQSQRSASTGIAAGCRDKLLQDSKQQHPGGLIDWSRSLQRPDLYRKPHKYHSHHTEAEAGQQPRSDR